MVLWTENHVKTLIPSLIVMLILAVLLKLWLGKKDDKIRIIPLQIVTIILLILEVFKQVISIIRGYDLYHIPLHFCSLFLFLFPLMSFYNGKHKDKVRAIATTISASLFLLMIIYPELIYSGNNIANTFKGFFDFHTVAFHTIATFGFFIIVALKLHTPSFKRDMKAIILFFIGYSIVAGVTAQILQTNFNNFYQCNVPPLEELRLSILAVLGRPLTQTLYVLIVTIVDLVFVTISYNLYRLLIFIIDKIKCKKALN
jgi:hypothetical protein